MDIPSQGVYSAVHGDIVALLKLARRGAARSVNALMTATYWSVGQRIVEFEQGGEDRAIYGDALLKRLGSDLSQQFGRGFGWRNLAQMRAFYLAWPAGQILQTLSAKSIAPDAGRSQLEKESARQFRSAPSEQLRDISILAQAFPLPWSAYVRLLSAKSRHARRFYEVEALRCAAVGRYASLTGR